MTETIETASEEPETVSLAQPQEKDGGDGSESDVRERFHRPSRDWGRVLLWAGPLTLGLAALIWLAAIFWPVPPEATAETPVRFTTVASPLATQEAAATDAIASLTVENRRLREQIAELKRPAPPAAPRRKKTPCDVAGPDSYDCRVYKAVVLGEATW